MADLDSREIYQLLLAISSYTELKRKILMCLAHVYPQAVSGVQLSKMIGYSGQARTLYRGVLDRLKADKVILLDKLTPKLYSIRINHNHHLMNMLVELAQKWGNSLKEKYDVILQKDEQNE
ncbi:MAG: hypothetical protein HWN66_00355 [Candidatus Helarchaeota archaeon]|nr:hypothetical protein [Candidatus Helarchaeota archaeon]